MSLEKTLKGIGLATAVTMGYGCASSGGLDYSEKKDLGDVYASVQTQQQSYGMISECFARAMENETYSSNSIDGVLDQCNAMDRNAFIARFGSDLAKAYLLTQALRSSSSSKSTTDESSTMGSGSQDSTIGDGF